MSTIEYQKQPWTTEEDVVLLKQFNQGTKITELATLHNCSYNAIKARFLNSERLKSNITTKNKNQGCSNPGFSIINSIINLNTKHYKYTLTFDTLPVFNNKKTINSIINLNTKHYKIHRHF